MVHRVVLLLCFLVIGSTIDVHIIYPLEKKVFEGIQRQGLNAFYELFPSSVDKFRTRGRAYDIPDVTFCEYVGKLVQNITTETPTAYVFILTESVESVDMCSNDWKSNDRLFTVEPINNNTKYIFANFNGITGLRGDWGDLVAKIYEDTPEPKDHVRGNVSDLEYTEEKSIDTIVTHTKGHFVFVPIGAILAAIYYCCRCGCLHSNEEENAEGTNQTEMKA